MRNREDIKIKTMGNPGKSRKIGVLFPYGHLDTAPELKSFITLAGGEGYWVDVLTLTSSRFTYPHFDNQNVTVKSFPWKQRRKGIPSILIESAFIPWMTAVLLKERYHCFVGAGLRGLLAASFIRLFKKAPLVYFNLELYLSEDMRSVYQKTYKVLERWCSRKAVFTIIQDKNRARLFSEDNQIPLDRILIFPTTTPGKAKKTRSDYMRKRFAIKENSKIILVAGSIEPWTMTRELTQAAQDWPDDWVLVLHSRLTPDKDYLAQIKATDRKKRVVFSLNPLPLERLGELISSADIGLVLSDGAIANIYHTGLSSGKLSQYLKCGVPVITTDFPAFKEIMDVYKCGVCIRYLEEIKQRILHILGRYDEFSQRSVNCFNELLALENYYPAVSRMLRELPG